MYHKADETVLWRQGSEYRAGCDPAASAWASGALRHSPWSPAWPPSAAPEGRCLQRLTRARSTWLSQTPQRGTKHRSLGNWTAHPGEMTACVDPGGLRCPHAEPSATGEAVKCTGPLSPAGRYAGGAGPSCSRSLRPCGTLYMPETAPSTYVRVTKESPGVLLTVTGAEGCSSHSHAEIFKEVVWSQTQSHPSSNSLANTLPRSYGNALLPFILTVCNTNQVLITRSTETLKRFPCPANGNS